MSDSIGEFLSTPSARRATPLPLPVRRPVTLFLSTPSARRATPSHPPHLPLPAISIHALREEGDTRFWMLCAGWMEFLSTPSARRAT